MKAARLFTNNHNIGTRLLRCSNTSNVTLKSNNDEKSSLSTYLHAKIKACGPITLAEYMKQALTHPTAGYYMTRDVFGADGDFITSPEISQLFGEMIGVWVLSEWRKISRNEFQLVELGPGRGTLSKDITKIFKQFRATDKLSIHLVEVSPALAEIQAKNLCVTTEDVTPLEIEAEEHQARHYKTGVTMDGIKVFWYYSLEDVPKKFSIFIAHEFFDALPIHKFQKKNGVWHEVFVDIDSTSDEKFRYVISPSPTLTSKLFISPNETRDHVELSPQSLAIVDYLSSFLENYGGFALIADYGHNGEKTDTFRAFKNHKQQDPLLNPGTADLTADVDFSMLKKIATKNERNIVFGPVEQKQFLLQLGIDVRLNMLLSKVSDNNKDELMSGYHMLVDDDKMGKCFKMFALYPAILKEHLKMWPVTGFFDDNSLSNRPKNVNDK